MSLEPHQLAFGMRGPEVGNWQRFLNATIFTELVVDEVFGSKSLVATTTYQNQANILTGWNNEKTGVVGPLTRKRAILEGFIPFIPARNYTLVGKDPAPEGLGRTIELLVVHTMESPSKPTTAENVAAWFAGDTAPRASAHYCIDTDSIVQCVRDRDVAWHAKQANRNGIGLEHAGYAKQTAENWKSPYNASMLLRSAQLAARLCTDYDIPIERLHPEDLRAKKRGICGHVDVTRAFDKGIGHWDPGPSWPWEDYLELIRANV